MFFVFFPPFFSFSVWGESRTVTGRGRGGGSAMRSPRGWGLGMLGFGFIVPGSQGREGRCSSSAQNLGPRFYGYLALKVSSKAYILIARTKSRCVLGAARMAGGGSEVRSAEWEFFNKQAFLPTLAS